MKKNFIQLLLLALFIAAIKTVVSFLISGPMIFTDEVCVLLRAEYFAEHFRLASCESLMHFPAGDPMPLYSILIAPIYLLLDSMPAYYAVMIFNSILMASLAFPLFKIFKKFIKKDWLIYINIFLLLFIPPVFLYEKLVMTEALFIIVNVWFLYFYMESFMAKRSGAIVRNKIIAAVLALLAAITRPFGFIVLVAALTNELIQTKKKKLPLTIMGAALFGIFILIPIQMPGIWEGVWWKISTMFAVGNIPTLLTAIKNQANTFIVATYLIPVILFFGCMFVNPPEQFKKIRFYLLAFIILNFGVSAQHLYGYLLNGEDLNLLSRYINMSIIYIVIFGAIFLQMKKYFSFTKGRLLITAIILFPLLFFTFDPVKHSLNMDISHYFYTGIGYIVSKGFLHPYFLPICLVLLLLLIFKKPRTLKIFLITIIIVNSIAIMYWERNFSFSEYNDPSWELFKNTEKKILFIQTPQNARLTYSKIKTLTNNEVEITFQPYILLQAVQNYDYIISTTEIPALPLLTQTNYLEGVYEVRK